MSDLSSLSAPVRKTIEGWHHFVRTKKEDDLRVLLAQDIVFHSPFSYSPLPGIEAAVLILTTVIQIFENFRYEREFAAGPQDVTLEFAANVGAWELKGVDLVKFDASGKITEFEVMVRPIKALQALGEQMSARIGPQLTAMRKAAGA